MTAQLIEANAKNFTLGRAGHKITRIVFHRTAVSGDTAVGEGNYFKTHVLSASAGAFIDANGVAVQSVADANTAWAVDEWDENVITFSIEFTGLNGTSLTQAQIASAINLIKGDPLLKAVANHRLAIGEIPARIVSGYETHHDITVAYKIAGGHVDAISEPEIHAILTGVFA